ncbi:tRNA pseudouridine(55) synthase TruB [Sporohalobacter salinus]|uniref:tRNA pseudouridine(55) synthase TruB n=1 Tax=Sporohalobacter salinus TaxID=1494606 RepID=UPI001961B4FD|nr:tRNA pseudouridine(55) synthase TruB [Sporohalobacter salinus]MBM7623473.1 tRNA pseudouridine55 synthase [Sporohalobacter salinus]
MRGVINFNKPVGLTSFQVVKLVRKKLDIRRVGHTGTLDPTAKGVLPICIGRGTKVVPFITETAKEYKAELKLGVQTDTLDSEGEVIARQKVPELDADEIGQVCSRFIGEIEQIPPMYSALKHNGKRLYELAREGKEVDRKSRQISIYDIEILGIELPLIRFKVTCSKGTYIRTLAADIGKELGVGAYLTSLLRTRVGLFAIEDSITLDEFSQLIESDQIANFLQPIDSGLLHLSKVNVERDIYKLVSNGATFHLEDADKINGRLAYEELVRVYSYEDEFLGVYRFVYNEESRNNLFKPVRLFC